MDYMKILQNTLVIAAGGMFLSAIPAFSQVPSTLTTFGGNNYQLWLDGGVSWDQAEANAATLGGTLAILTGSAQTADVFTALLAGSGAEVWVGASPAIPDANGATMDPNNWAWVNGAPWTAFDAGNFDPGEPNGDFFSHLAIDHDGAPTFNDEGNAANITGYIVETAATTSTPDAGSTVAMLGMAVAGISWMRRKI